MVYIKRKFLIWCDAGQSKTQKSLIFQVICNFSLLWEQILRLTHYFFMLVKLIYLGILSFSFSIWWGWPSLVIANWTWSKFWGLLYYFLEMVKYLDIEIQFMNTKTFNIELVDWIIFDHKFEAYLSYLSWKWGFHINPIADCCWWPFLSK